MFVLMSQLSGHITGWYELLKAPKCVENYVKESSGAKAGGQHENEWDHSPSRPSPFDHQPVAPAHHALLHPALFFLV